MSAVTLRGPSRGRYAVLVQASDTGRPRPLYSTAWLNVVMTGPARRHGTVSGLAQKTWKHGISVGTRYGRCHHVTGHVVLIAISLLRVT